MKQLHLSLIVLLALLLTACPKVPQGNLDLEDNKLEDNFEIKMSNGGGMINISENLKVSKEESFWTYSRYGKETTVKWSTSEEELSELCKMLRKNNSSKITSNKKEEVYDRGGYDISIQNGDHVTRLNNSGRSFIDEKWQENFKAIRTEIDDYARTKVYHGMIFLNMQSTAKVRDAKIDIKVDFDGENAYKTFDILPSSHDAFKAFIGFNRVNIRTFYLDSTNSHGKRILIDQYSEFIEIDSTDKVIYLDIEEGVLKVKKEL